MVKGIKNQLIAVVLVYPTEIENDITDNAAIRSIIIFKILLFGKGRITFIENSILASIIHIILSSSSSDNSNSNGSSTSIFKIGLTHFTPRKLFW